MLRQATIRDSHVERALILVNYNGRWLLEQFFPSVVAAAAHASKPTRIYIVDNNSEDGSAAWLAQHYPQIHLIRSPKNHFWGGGNNLGARAAIEACPSLRWLIFLNNDVQVPAHFCDAITDVPQDERIGIVGVKSVFLPQYLSCELDTSLDGRAARWGGLSLTVDGPVGLMRDRILCSAPLRRSAFYVAGPTTLRVPVQGSAGKVVLRLTNDDPDGARQRVVVRASSPGSREPGDTNLISASTLSCGRSMSVSLPWRAANTHAVINNAGSFYDSMTGECGDIGINQPDLGQYDKARFVDAICGVAMAVRPAVYRALSGFDTAYSMYFEDTDFCLRAAAQGLRCWYNPAAAIRHLHGATSKERSSWWNQQVLRSQFIFRSRLQPAAQLQAWWAAAIKTHGTDLACAKVFEEIAAAAPQQPIAAAAYPLQGRALCV